MIHVWKEWLLMIAPFPLFQNELIQWNRNFHESGNNVPRFMAMEIKEERKSNFFLFFLSSIQCFDKAVPPNAYLILVILRKDACFICFLKRRTLSLVPHITLLPLFALPWRYDRYWQPWLSTCLSLLVLNWNCCFVHTESNRYFWVIWGNHFVST